MFRNPFLNALCAEIYIMIIVLLIQSLPHVDDQKTILMPIMMLSLFVLSASVMGFLFLAEPIQLYVENQKKDALIYFAKTVATFALITLVVFLFVVFTL